MSNEHVMIQNKKEDLSSFLGNFKERILQLEIMEFYKNDQQV